MDGTLRNERKLSLMETEKQIMQYAAYSKSVEGTLTIVWQNSFLYGDWKAWGDLYKKILPQLKDLI